MLGYHLENFLEGYARIVLNYTCILLKKFRHATILNDNGYGINLPDILLTLCKSFIGEEYLRFIDIREVKQISLLQVYLEELLGKLLSEDVIFVGWRPNVHISILLNKRAKALIIPTYSRNYTKSLLKSLRLIKNMNTPIIVLNPYISCKLDSFTFLKQHPPINSLFFEVGHYVIERRFVSDGVVYRFMGRLHPFRGYKEAVIAFKKFKSRCPSTKTKLVIDSFSEDIRDEEVRKIRICDDVYIILWNPLYIIKKGLASTAKILDEIVKKYATSSYILLPYMSWQFIEPPLVLLEALATGSFVVTSDLMKPFINDEVTYSVSREKIVEDLVKAYEYLYEIYDSNYYWSIRRKAYEYALKNFSFDAVYNKVFNVLGDVLD